MHFAVKRLMISPQAIGRNAPDALMNGNSLAANRNPRRRVSLGKLPFARPLMNRRRGPTKGEDGSVQRSSRCSALSPDGPAAVPRGNECNIRISNSSEKSKLAVGNDESVRKDSLVTTVAGGWSRRNISNVASVLGAILLGFSALIARES